MQVPGAIEWVEPRVLKFRRVSDVVQPSSSHQNVCVKIQARSNDLGEFRHSRHVNPPTRHAGSQMTLGKSAGRRSEHITCLLYTSPSPRDGLLSRMPSSA